VFPRAYAKTGRKFKDVQFHEDRLDQPLRWRKPRRVFVNSMSDLFHESLTYEQIEKVFDVMIDGGAHHIYQVLTKRPDRMKAFVERYLSPALLPVVLRNVWLGVSCEDQKTADERIPLLLQTPAAVRFVSAEPLLGPIDFRAVRWGHANALTGLDWIIVGGESGPGARRCDVAWVRSIVRQCSEASVPVFVKQLGAWPSEADPDDDLTSWPEVAIASRNEPAPLKIHLEDRKGGDPSEWPEDLRVREFPFLAALWRLAL
jgi:protein gp37